MYPNPFDRKHSTIRQVIDKFLKPDFNNNKKSSNKWTPKMNLQRYDSSSSTNSSASARSAGSASSASQVKESFLFAVKT